MIKLDGVSVTLGQSVILENVTAEIKTGEFVVIVGPNGAGKSSLLKLIAGDLFPSCGNISIHGRPWSTLSVWARATRMGRVYQDPAAGTVHGLSVRENLALALYKGKRIGCLPYDVDVETSSLAARVQDVFAGHDILNIRINKLSGGQRQMLAFLMATAYPVDFLLLDEPMAALDYRSALTMIDLIGKFAAHQEGHTIILVTHDLKIAVELGTTLWVVRDGVLQHRISGADKRKLTVSDIERLMYG